MINYNFVSSDKTRQSSRCFLFIMADRDKGLYSSILIEKKQIWRTMDAFRLLGIAECHHLSSSVLSLARQIWWTDGHLQQWRADCSPALQSTECVHHVTAVIHQNRGKKYHLFLQPLLHLTGLSIHYIDGSFPSLFYNSTNRIFLQCYRSVNKLITVF